MNKPTKEIPKDKSHSTHQRIQITNLDPIEISTILPIDRSLYLYKNKSMIRLTKVARINPLLFKLIIKMIVYKINKIIKLSRSPMTFLLMKVIYLKLIF